jgi:hypothetical protein
MQRAQPHTARVAALLGAAACALALAVPLIGGAARPSYSHVSQLVSELGESGASGAGWVAGAGFAPIGLLVLGFLAAAARVLPASRRTRLGLLCLGAVGAGYLAAAAAPCDPGCPSTGSLSQSVHNVFGLLEYLGAAAGLLLLRAAFAASPPWAALARPSALAAAGVALGFAGMLAPPFVELRGLAQRLAEASIFLWIARLSYFLVRRRA